jgi:3-methyladenine DNA glycosylase AlkD
MEIQLEKPASVAEKINIEIQSLSLKNTPEIRKIRRKYTKILRKATPEYIKELALLLIKKYGYRSTPYELIRYHKPTFQKLDEIDLEDLGEGINSWWSVDSFARTLTGPAWLNGNLEDEVIIRWAKSDDLWWRRAALVSTVALNVRSHGGYGDTARTLSICSLLVDDHEDMVVKALSWALRELVTHDPHSVRSYLDKYDNKLAARVKREVKNKLETGLKNP